MCKECLENVREIFPEVPAEEIGDFLLSTTCYPFGTAKRVRSNLLENRSLMKTTDYRECYEIAENLLTEEMMRLSHAES